VTLSPRALLGAAPAVIVLAGSFLLSRTCLSEADRAEGPSAASVGSRGETVQPATAADEDRLHRVAIKDETVDDLLCGRLTFEEAIARFELLAASAEAGDAPSARVGGNTATQRAVYQVLSFARVRANHRDEQYAGPLARVEAEAEAFLARTQQSN
jgi:hypothetical protein